MKKASECIEYLENEFDLELTHQQKVDLEGIMNKPDDIIDKNVCFNSLCWMNDEAYNQCCFPAKKLHSCDKRQVSKETTD